LSNTAQGRLGYVHFRNVTGKVPYYRETFIDDGDVDMIRVMDPGRELIRRRADSDHTLQMSCSAPWHAGMAYALGYMRAAMQLIDRE
jgi:mannonate dehydratase